MSAEPARRFNEAMLARLGRYCEHVQSYSVNVPEGTYICPCCTRGWSLEYLVKHPEVLDKGHVVPEAIGGRTTVLECSQCNQRHGSRSDAAFVAANRRHGFGRDFDIKLRGIVTIAGSTLPVEVGINGADLRLDVPRKVSEHYATKVIDQLDAMPQPEFELSISVRAHTILLLGHLHLAHLAMFRAFGYEYRISKAGFFAVSLLAERNWPETVPIWTRTIDVPVPLTLGEIVMVTGDGCRSYGVYTGQREDGSGLLTIIPDLDSGDLAWAESGNDVHALRLAKFAQPAYFAEKRPEEAFGLARHLLNRYGWGAGTLTKQPSA